MMVKKEKKKRQIKKRRKRRRKERRKREERREGEKNQGEAKERQEEKKQSWLISSSFNNDIGQRSSNFLSVENQTLQFIFASKVKKEVRGEEHFQRSYED